MKQTPRVALLMIPSSWYDRGLLEGVTSYAQIHGPWVFCLSGDHPEMPLPASDSLSGNLSTAGYVAGGESKTPIPNIERLQLTGVIGRIQSGRMAKRLVATGLPVIGSIVLPESECEELDLRAKISEIVVDAGKMGTLAAEHFIERGFRNYAFCGYEARAWSERRLNGFAERLRNAGFSPSVYQAAAGRRSFSWKQELPLVTSWLKSLPRPVAVMACNDKRGRQVLEACLLGGLKVPEDVAVIGVDNDHLFGNLSNPPLSSIALNLTKAGYEAAELLDNLMRGRIRKPRQIVIEPLWVVPRRSSDVIAVDEPAVAAALRFIREHAKESIGVDDVTREAGISRRGLETRFQTVLGRSIHAEIQRVRLQIAKQFLIETNLSVERIAALTGFCSLSHLGTTFRHETGMTPARYRRSRCIS
jgi:LacI family transcriptional regulator